MNVYGNEFITTWLKEEKQNSTHLQSLFDKLSSEHCSGISLAQLDSPMMKQFRVAKEEVPDALIFFRMGDFYELFGIDAVIASHICGLTLTTRDKNNPTPVPMAGAPVSGYKNHLKKCVQAGFKVAICEQMEDAKLTKGLVKREIVRIATPAVPGDLEEDNSLISEISTGCYLTSILNYGTKYTLSFIDVSTGEFRITTNLTKAELFQEIETIQPKEILTTKLIEIELLEYLKTSSLKTFISKIENWILRSEELCQNLFFEFFTERELNSFGLSTISYGLECVTSLLHYLKLTQKNCLKNIKYIAQYDVADYLIIDNATKKHLDFFQISTGEKKGSLFQYLNRCSTAIGSRHLMRRLNYPFKNNIEIEKSLNFIENQIQNPQKLNDLISILKNTFDIEKLLSKCAQKSIDPRGIMLLRSTLQQIPKLNVFATQPCDPLTTLCNILEKSLVDDCSFGKGEVVFKSGFHSEFDEILELELNFNKMLEELERNERERSQISTLKIGYTRVFGYYFEVSKGKLAQVPSYFIRKQTLSTGERYITQELKELEEKALTASERRTSLEKEILESLILGILQYSNELLHCAQFIGTLDVLSNFAQISLENSWVRPQNTDESILDLKNCVHPVLAHYYKEKFVSNHVHLENIHLITGPNMAGKSTLMRQIAICQVLAQMGSFVPASEAKIGLVDRILTRIGSSDHSLKNQSTFMVEMLETANLLRLATHKSLLILDEIGRGTSTYDGLSLAWSILEYLHDNTKARTLFSTHYHELSELTVQCPNIKLMQMGVFENQWQDENGQIKNDILFSRKYIPGSAEKSYGIHVAQLAGIPNSIIQRAEMILQNLESRQKHSKNIKQNTLVSS